MTHEQLTALVNNVFVICVVVFMVFGTIAVIGGGIFCVYISLKEHFEAERRDKSPSVNDFKEAKWTGLDFDGNKFPDHLPDISGNERHAKRPVAKGDMK